jgi:uracil-DNA glycosylase family 4
MTLDQKISKCQKCPRLISYIEGVAKVKRKSFQDQTYWGRPVPNFGDYDGQILIVGLAPAAHGANRTGRMFTGDRSGEWLYRALHKAGLANQALSVSADDGLELQNCLITAVAHCAPPDNKPEKSEITNCSVFLESTIQEMKSLKVIIGLGSIAWENIFKYLKTENLFNEKIPKFSHSAEVRIENLLILGSYHPSQQNTFTGRLTEPMFDEVFEKATRGLA